MYRDCRLLSRRIHGRRVVVDVEARVVRFSQGEFEVSIPNGVREQLISGNWDSLRRQLLDAEEDVVGLAAGLPYTASLLLFVKRKTLQRWDGSLCLIV